MNFKSKMLRGIEALKHNSVVAITIVVVVSAAVIISAGLEKKITIDDNGRIIKVSTYKTNVKDALSSVNVSLGEKDKVSPGLDSKINNDMTIKIKRAIPVKVAFDNKKILISTPEDTVGALLKTEGIVLNENDKISPAVDTAISKDMEIKIVRVVEDIKTTTEKIAYQVIKKTDNNLEKGQTKVIQNGMDGEVEIKTKVVYEDGKEVLSKRISQVIKKAPLNKVIAVGTLSWFTPSRGEGGSKVLYTKKIRMKATSYTASYECTGKRPGDRGFGITATGTRARRNPNGYSTVAVDPSIIPLGTKLYIEGYGYAIAEDTGGGVRGNIIDLYFEPDTSEFRRWFTHYVSVYVLK